MVTSMQKFELYDFCTCTLFGKILQECLYLNKMNQCELNYIFL